VNLRTKTFLTVGGITALLVAVLVMAVNRLVLHRFESLEREQAEESLLRVRNLLFSELDHLASLAGDWGSRAAAPGIREGAFAESVPESAMARHRVDLILLFDPDGQPAFRRMRGGQIPCFRDSAARRERCATSPGRTGSARDSSTSREICGLSAAKPWAMAIAGPT
jgi:hypothetical protein